jgi:uncharacterized protein
VNTKINIVTIAVQDLECSLAFYLNVLEFPASSVVRGEDHIAFHLMDSFSFVLYDRMALARDAGEPVSAYGSRGFSLTHFVDCRSDLNALLERVQKAGAPLIGETIEESWGHLARFKDMDGHLWEVMCTAKAEGSKGEL